MIDNTPLTGLPESVNVARRIKSDARKIFLDEGLLLTPSEHFRFEKEISNFKKVAAKDILHNVFADVDVPSEVFDKLLRPVAFGHLEAKTIHSLCGGERDFSKKLGEIGGVYVAWVCYFDELCDKSPDIIQHITKHVDKKLLSKAINGSSSNKNIFLQNLPKNIDSRLIPLFILWQTYIQESKKLYESSMRKNVWSEFTTTISAQYSQQLDCIEIKIPNFQPDMWETIRTRSSSPLWVNFLINFLSNDTNLKFYSPRLRDAILRLGDVAKIVDDIIDLTDDLSDRRWNYVLIKAFEKHPSIFDKIDRQDNLEIIQLIIDKGILNESIRDACSSYHSAMNELKKIGLFTRDFEQYMKLFLSNWFKHQ